jgi:hypothetical protein
MSGSSIAVRHEQIMGDLFLPLQSLYVVHDSVPDLSNTTIQRAEILLYLSQMVARWSAGI